MSAKEQHRIDVEVGMSQTNKQVVFGSYLHEWSVAKLKEKKLPEKVFFGMGV